VLASVASVNSSPEFSRYKSSIETKLAAIGYTIVQSPSEARYIALVAYGMDVDQVGFVSTPVFGGGTMLSPSGGAYVMPSYGVVGPSSPPAASYKRALAVDIVDAASMKAGKPRKVLELRTTSVGSSSSIGCVFNDMLEAMFMDFPGISGKARSVTVMYKGDC
jgi:hypothetical protein